METDRSAFSCSILLEAFVSGKVLATLSFAGLMKALCNLVKETAKFWLFLFLGLVRGDSFSRGGD